MEGHLAVFTDRAVVTAGRGVPACRDQDAAAPPIAQGSLRTPKNQVTGPKRQPRRVEEAALEAGSSAPPCLPLMGEHPLVPSQGRARPLQHPGGAVRPCAQHCAREGGLLVFLVAEKVGGKQLNCLLTENGRRGAFRSLLHRQTTGATAPLSLAARLPTAHGCTRVFLPCEWTPWVTGGTTRVQVWLHMASTPTFQPHGEGRGERGRAGRQSFLPSQTGVMCSGVLAWHFAHPRPHPHTL